eukprot:352597-Chlamydomonas_euryale.AAC.5
MGGGSVWPAKERTAALLGLLSAHRLPERDIQLSGNLRLAESRGLVASRLSRPAAHRIVAPCSMQRGVGGHPHLCCIVDLAAAAGATQAWRRLPLRRLCDD